jgi:hypothetical protein
LDKLNHAAKINHALKWRCAQEQTDENSRVLSHEDLAEIAIQHWRIKKKLEIIGGDSQVGLNFALRKMGQILAKNRIEVVDLDGMPFSTGSAVEVLESDGSGSEQVMKTVEPIVLIDRQVVRFGKVTTQRPGTN